MSLPGPTLGVVGGGQLARMLGEAAGPLGVALVVSDPTPDCPAAPVVREQIVGSFDDPAATREVADRADYLTFEIELADPDVLAAVREATGTPVHPDPETLRTVQDKLVQKRRLRAAGVPVPAFRAVDSPGQLREALEELGTPAMLKAREGGYDGRGNVPIEHPADAAEAYAAVDGPAMVEEFVDFECELAVIGCLGDGERAAFPVTETVHEAEILRATCSPPRVPEHARERAREVTNAVLDAMDGRGVYGVELFYTPDRTEPVLLNEIAPRPHNSGHWTIEGCHTSQFEQHVRAVTGRPLGTTERRCPTASVNILGDVTERERADLAGVDDVLARDRVALHWYGKREVYDLRKMGHLTVPGPDVETALTTARAAGERLRF